jgi:hypothetical protein
VAHLVSIQRKPLKREMEHLEHLEREYCQTKIGCSLNLPHAVTKEGQEPNATRGQVEGAAVAPGPAPKPKPKLELLLDKAGGGRMAAPGAGAVPKEKPSVEGATGAWSRSIPKGESAWWSRGCSARGKASAGRSWRRSSIVVVSWWCEARGRRR